MPIEQEQYYQRLWETNRETVQQHFWKNLAYTQSFSTREEVEKAARDCEISLPSALCPVLLRFWPGSPRWYYTVGGTTDDHASVHTRVNKAVQACLQTMDIPNIPCLSISVFGYHTSLLLFPAEHGNGPISYILKQLLACRDELALDMTLLLGAADPPHLLYEGVEALRTFSYTQVYYDNQIVPLPSPEIGEVPPPTRTPDLEKWISLMESSMYHQAMEHFQTFFYSPEVRPYISVPFLENFKHQLLDRVRDLTAIRKCHYNFMSDLSDELIHNADKSVPDFLVFLDRVIQVIARKTESAGDHRLLAGEIANFVREHIGEDLSRERIASRFFVSADHLNRIFKSIMHMTLSEYVLQQRLELSQALLTGSDLSLTDIAHQVGFSSSSYFSTTFKTHIGCTPTAYRRPQGTPKLKHRT